MKQYAYTKRRGFTIVEIVMAVIIISVLTLVLTPTLTSRTEDAKKRAAEQDLESLANAEERASIDTGYFYRPYVLNDVSREGDYIPSAPKTWPPASNLINRIDALWDNADVTNNIYLQPTQIFINIHGTIDKTSGNTSGQKFADNQAGLWQRLVTNETAFGWGGPYLNWRRDVNHNDWPDDPWGNDYLFFTQSGVIYPPLAIGLSGDSEMNTDKSYQFQNKGPKFNGTKQVKADFVFDRPTWLSLGPDGLPGNGSGDENGDGAYGKGDDIIYQFGGR